MWCKLLLIADDIFGIDEISIYEGEWDENVYSVSGEVLDSVSSSYILCVFWKCISFCSSICMICC